MMGLRRTAAPRRRAWVKILTLVSLLVLGGTSVAAERSMSAGSRRRSLEKLRAAGDSKGQAGGGAVVVVDGTKFDRYITGVPRQYEAVVFFTAAGANYKCTSCRVHLDEFTTMAESYQAARANTPETLNGVDVYFFVADFGQNQLPFQKLGLQTVPKILHFPPALAEGDDGRYAIDQSQHMHMAGQVKAEDMARFVKEKTGVSFPIIRPEPPVMIILVGLLVVAALAIKPILSNLGALLRVIRNKYLWLATSLLVYTFGISGGVYDIIRNPAPFMVKQDGFIMWFHPQSNVQFVAEGFITGIMTLMCGLSGILLVHVAPKLRNSGYRQVAVCVCGVIFLMLFSKVMSLYKSKNMWYRPVF
ncbi:conserved unknown protein [Ectocarpus siliculosus]|uniref:Uncharacterized protein n=1 Tax=Ectocarpus siliculosus TaxID=2880 RepID=D8LPZ2_ECTSI|nr:conserved unknown protein [Ectocarpus siliculosus]|eukprot:CBN74884.1 conserved unknown protein [Ectocarpus siliculosus]